MGGAIAVATFDTLKFANTLKTSGVPDKQAEAQAVAFAEVISVNFKELTTKDDLKVLEDKLSQKIESSSLQLRNEMVGLRSEQVLIRWMIGFGFALGLALLGMTARLLLR